MPVFYQNFDSLAVGSTTVPGAIVSGAGRVVTPGVHLGINANAGNAWKMVEDALLVEFASLSDLDIWFDWKHTASIPCGKLVSFGLWDSVNQNAFVEWGWLFQEADYSISSYVNAAGGAVLNDNTTQHAPGEGGAFQQRADQRWGIFFQLDIHMTTVTIGGVTFVAFNGGVYADGEHILTLNGTTGFVVGSPLGSAGATIGPACNWVRWSAGGPLNSAELDEVTIDVPPGSLPSYPNPGSPKARVTQGIIEANILPSTANVRATQGVIEANILPSTANIRITQGVIELLLGSPAGRGPEYIKRRIPGSS